MIDFNDEKITEQEKQDFLTQQIDPEYKKKRKKYGYIPFQAGWIIDYRMLEILNNDAYENEGVFDFYKEDIKLYDPSMTCALFEGDLIKEGEWDRFYKCWSKRDYIRCKVIFPREGLITRIEEEKLEICVLKLDPDDEEIFKEKICKYPNTWNIDGTQNKEGGGSGVIEFDPKLLEGFPELGKKTQVENHLDYMNDLVDSLEDSDPFCVRIKNSFWGLKANFDSYVSHRIKSHQEHTEKKDNRRNIRRKRSKSKLKKSFKKGFSL